MTKTISYTVNVEDRSRGKGQRIDPAVMDKPGQPYVGEHAPERTPERTPEYVSTADLDRMKNRR